MTTSSPPPDLSVAAIDLGSNSFHLVVARFVGGQLQIVDRLKERVQLAAGLTDEKRLEDEVASRALACLGRFGQLIKRLPPGHVAAVGTSTLRQLRDGRSFVSRASEALGHNIEVVSGHEEARLIYLGVAHTLQSDQRRLVVDIGGGSTECIVGERYDTLETDSLHMGCVNFSLRFFPEGRVSENKMHSAEKAAARELLSMGKRYRDRGWHTAAGCSGTILAISGILREAGWTDGSITLAGLQELRGALIAGGSMKRISLLGLSEERRDVLPGGLAILRSVFDVLGVEKMQPSDAALREGALYELRGRIEDADIRDITVERMMERFHVDQVHAERVEDAALRLYDLATDSWFEDPATRDLLRWAARVHEIGLSISHAGCHKHAAYLVRNSDMDGFSQDMKSVLAALVESHRRKLRKEVFETVPAERRRDAIRACMLLRIARKLTRSRAESLPEHLEFSAQKKKLSLRLPADWVAEHSVTQLDLVEEAEWVSRFGYSLELV